MNKPRFDRSGEDLGNIVNLGHANFRVPDQRLATIFYITGLGLTRDPAMMTGVDNMWVNVGDSQFHLPTGEAVVAPGLVTGLVVPDPEALRWRLERVGDLLLGTEFAFFEEDGAIEAICPWGNRIRCHAPDPDRFGTMILGMAYNEFEVPQGRAERIARFYRDTLGGLADIEHTAAGARACVAVGDHQFLYFQERPDPRPPCAEHHIQIYIANFSGPYRALLEAGLNLEESSQHQYRFLTIPDSDTRETLFTLDHEVRSMTHPMYGRPLVNRNASQTTRDYRAGHDFQVSRRGRTAD